MRTELFSFVPNPFDVRTAHFAGRLRRAVLLVYITALPQSRIVADAVAFASTYLTAPLNDALLFWFAMVVSLMVAARHKFKILKTVIKSVAVLVMHNLVICELPAKEPFHDCAMLVGVGI